MFIKICGLSTPETVAAAVTAGADAVGFVFAPGSPRTITADVAARLIAGVPTHVETVGVFRNQPLDEVIAAVRASGVRTAQLHGSEPVEDVLALEKAGIDTLRAFAAEDYAGLGSEERKLWDSRRILLDAVNPGAGETFDPRLVTTSRPSGFWLLAGGLDPQNVAELIRALRPSGVDVSSGVESERGVKSAELIEEFIRQVRLS